MSITSHRPNEEAYEVMSQTDEDDRPLSASSVADVSKLLGSKSAIVQMDRVQPVGSLSRNEHRSWYFLGHGAVDAILSLGPVLFLGKVLVFLYMRVQSLICYNSCPCYVPWFEQQADLILRRDSQGDNLAVTHNISHNICRYTRKNATSRRDVHGRTWNYPRSKFTSCLCI
jgi:hypothetical protein